MKIDYINITAKSEIFCQRRQWKGLDFISRLLKMIPKEEKLFAVLKKAYDTGIWDEIDDGMMTFFYRFLEPENIKKFNYSEATNYCITTFWLDELAKIDYTKRHIEETKRNRVE